VLFNNCSAQYGGAIYVALLGTLLYNDNFTSNSASQAGIDIYENRTSIQSFYTASTFQFCCSSSTGILFALNDGTDKSNLLSTCVPPSGERYISSVSSFDPQNQCLNIDSPCETLANAISTGQAAGESTISVTVIGQFEGATATIPSGEVVHIHGPENSQSLFLS
jgi:hypothetical protein